MLGLTLSDLLLLPELEGVEEEGVGVVEATEVVVKGDAAAAAAAAAPETSVVAAVTGVMLRVVTVPCGRLGGSCDRAPYSTYCK